MKLSTMLAKCNRKVLMMVAAGAALTQVGLSGCNPGLRDTLLTGIETSLVGLVGTFIQGFFQALMSSNRQTTSQPVVQAILDHLPTLV